MRAYATFFRIRFTCGLQYRSAAYAGMITQFFWGLMEVLLFHAFYQSGPAAFPMGFSQLSSYIWLQQAFLALFMMWSFDSSIFQSITDGSVAYELCRPLNLYGMWLVKSAAMRISRAALRSAPLLVVAFFLPQPYGMRLPPDLGAFCLFIASLILGFLVGVAMGMLIYISAFYTMSSTGLRLVAASLIDFLCGGIIPLPFFPEPARRVLELLPFAAMQNMPFRIYSGNLPGGAAVKSLLLQLFWATLLLLAGILWMRRAVKRVVVQGW